MLRGKAMIALLIVLVVNNVLCDDIFELYHREDPCVALCEKLPQISLNDQYEKLCCQRGCRFFNLVDLRYDLVINNLNSSKDACESSCTEAYVILKDRSACMTGCNFMAAQRAADFLALLSADTEDSNVLLWRTATFSDMSLDMPENDAMTDPGLRKELLPGWWDMEGFKLPQTFIKSVAKDTDSMGDDGGSAIYHGKTKESLARNNSYWFKCGSRYAGIPGWMIHLLLGLCLTIVILFCQWRWWKKEWDRTSAATIARKRNVTSKLAILIPDEVPLHKTPPPKYSEIANVDDVNFKQ